jgi:serine protease AprX
MSLSLSIRRTGTLVVAVGVTTLMALAPAGSLASAGSPTHADPAAASSTSALGRAFVDPALRGVRGTAHIVVQGARSSEAQVTRLGGRITSQLPIIGGYSATVSADDLHRISRLPGVTAITRDGTLDVQALPGDDTTDSGSGSGPADVYQQVVHADDLRSHGDNGQGVTVALIDTGVTALPDVASRLVKVATNPLGTATANCVNLTGDGTCDDLYGHGTFLAGLIAGTGAASGGTYTGVAPSAKIVSVKIAGADGSADISKVIAGLQWVTAFHSMYNIKVLNLSLGSDSDQSYSLSPLDFAVEQAWKAGIAVVVSASNLGPAAQTIDKPADDPFVITVGAVDDNGTADPADDSVPNFSSRGPTKADGLAKPDLAAPGANLVSLAAPGAAITTQFPPSIPAPYRHGSGTSMSAAVTSGLVADVLSAKPSWSPDRVKYALTSTATPEASDDRMAVGSGVVNGYAALSAPAGLANQGIPASTGHGSLQADRGHLQVTVPGAGSASANPLTGEITAQLTPWSAVSNLFAGLVGALSWYGSNWYGSNWYGSNWYGSNWYGSNWYGSNWYGSNWYGVWD